jgi:hypothetical protein
MGREHGLAARSSVLASRTRQTGTGSLPAPTQKRAPPRPHPRPPREAIAAANLPPNAHFTHVFVLILLASTRAIYRCLKHANWPFHQLFMPRRALAKFYFPRVGVRSPQHGRFLEIAGRESYLGPLGCSLPWPSSLLLLGPFRIGLQKRKECLDLEKSLL